MEYFLQDVRYGVRMLWKRPSFTLVAVLSLGLGIGANTTIFTIVNAVFLAALPIADPSTVARVYTVDWENPTALTGVSFPNYEDYRDNNTVFSALAAFASFTMNLVPSDGEPRQVDARIVTGNYFTVLGVTAHLGRTFLPEEDQVPTAVAVLSFGLWEREFGADPAIVGSVINLGERPFTVIGVAQPGFKGLQTIGNPDLVWVPMEMRDLILTGLLGQYFHLRRGRFAQVVGRLKPGVTVDQARAEIHAIGQRLAEEYPTDNRGREGDVQLYSPVNPNQAAQYGRVGLLMMAVVGVVLLIACANVANLLLARAAEREKEIGIRIALGADRVRLVRQLLTESLLLSLLGGAAGMAIAVWGRDLMWAYRPPTFGAQAVDLTLDATVLTFNLGIALITGGLFGLVPALQATKPNRKETLQQGGRRSSASTNKGRLRAGLVVAEVALALVSLIGAGLFIRSMRNAQAVDPGFEREHLALMRLNIGNAGYDRGRGEQFYREVLERVLAVPGVVGASLQSGRLLGGGLPHTTFPEGVDIAGGRGLHVNDIAVTPSYFDAVGIELRQGRVLSDFDRDGTTRVAVINEATRELFWPDSDPVGRRFTRSVENFPIEVVGVVSNALIDLGESAQPVIYTALDQFYQDAVQLHVRTEGDPNTAIRSVQQAIREADPNLPVLEAATIGETIDQALWAPRMGMTLLGVFGALALALAVVGIYGVMSYSVAQRHHEIGLRLALGSEPGRVVRLVLRQGMQLVALGLVVGMGLALATTRLMQTMLWGVSTSDPMTFVVVPLALASVALLANFVPAIRVTRVDPLIAMREE